jgi:hypothetical protein
MALGGPPRNHKNLAANAIFTPGRGKRICANFAITES